MKKVSVIIPCFNATKYLPKCFMSLVQQTIGIDQIELIFVDDASTDEDATWNMLQEFERAYPESIMILKLEENMRQGGARNVALQYLLTLMTLSLKIFCWKLMKKPKNRMLISSSLNIFIIQTVWVPWTPVGTLRRK